jgi:hypothetical protein
MEFDNDIINIFDHQKWNVFNATLTGKESFKKISLPRHILDDKIRLKNELMIEYNNLVEKEDIDLNNVTFRSLSNEKIDFLKKSLKDHSKKEQDYIKKQKFERKQMQVKRLNTNDIFYKNFIENNWKLKNKSSTMRGIKAEENHEQSQKFIDKFAEYLSEEVSTDHFLRVNDIMNLGMDNDVMNKMKEVMMNNHKKIFSKYKKINLSHCSEFVSRFCYTLLNMSCNTFSSNDFQFSNLGYKNVCLIVRGGKKIYQTKSSRPYRIIYPIPEFIYNFRNLFSQSSQFFNIGDKFYLLTSWSKHQENVLTDMCFMNFKTCCNFTNTLVRNEELNLNINKTLIYPYILMFNNRRSTEANLANLRYSIVNPLGIRNSLITILTENLFICKDIIQSNIISNFCKNYNEFIKNINDFSDSNFNKSIINPINGWTVNSMTEFVTLIYCTYGMTKAPYNQQIEQVKNLVPVLKTHKTYIQEMDNADNMEKLFKILKEKHLATFMSNKEENNDKKVEIEKNKDNLWNNDFYFEPEHCFKIGEVAGSYYKTKGVINDINQKWYKILNDSYLDVTTHSGMRSDNMKRSGKDSFFGRKAHEVVMEELLRDLETLNIDSFKGDFKTLNEKLKVMKSINKYNITYKMKIEGMNKIKITFHQVDKVQWKGSREIYVMTLKTKILQQPLEKMFAYLSKISDNEIISIPSNKRLQKVHGLLFDKTKTHKNFNKYYLTFDCKKWGPRAMYPKYLMFVLGMSSILPNSFVEYMMAFTNMYFQKEVIISKGCWEIYKHNLDSNKYKDFLIEYPDLETVGFNMPYSFVMGIFNYLSSLMHAFNQKHLNTLLKNYFKDKYNLLAEVDMVAHSDDSGGVLYIENCNDPKIKNKMKIIKNEDYLLDEALKIIEIDLKRTNHMLSVKKCLVSKKYFELLSILYINDRLLPLTPKFFSNMSFKPTLSGYTSDISQGYGKCTELIAMGATFAEAFFNMRSYSEMVNSMYHLEPSSSKPISTFGGLYSHPILVMLLGSMADNLRLFNYNRVNLIKYNVALKLLNGKNIDIIKQSGIKPTLPINKRSSIPIHKEKLENIYGKEFLENDFFKNVKIKNSVFFGCSYYHMLNDIDFQSSLSYGDNTRKLSRIFVTSNSNVYQTLIGQFSVKDLSIMIDLFIADIGNENFKKILSNINITEEMERMDQIYYSVLGSANSIYEYLNENLNERIDIVPFNSSCKPTHINMDLSWNRFNVKEDSSMIYYTDNEMFYTTGYMKNLKEVKNDCLKVFDRLTMKKGGILKNIDYSNFRFYFQFFTKTNNVNHYIYSYIPSQDRNVTNYKDLLTLIETNSVFGYKFLKLYKFISSDIKFELKKLHIDNNLIQDLTNVKNHLFLKNILNEDEYSLIFNKKRTMASFDKESVSSVMYRTNNEVTKSIIDAETLWYNKHELNSENLNICYGWIKKQYRTKNGWKGKGSLWMKISDTYFLINILNEYIINIEYRGNIKSLDDNQISVMWLMIQLNEIKFSLNLNTNNFDDELKIGFINVQDDKPLITKSSNLKIIISELIENNNIPIPTKLTKTNRFMIFNDYLNKFEIKFLPHLLPLTMNSISENYFTIDNQLKNNIINNLFEENKKSNIDFTINFIFDNFINTDIYKFLVFSKVYDDNYNLEYCVKDYCKYRKFNYKPISELMIDELVDINIDPELINQDVANMMIDKLLIEENVDVVTEFYDDCTDAIKKKDFKSLFLKWVEDGFLNTALEFRKRNVIEIIQNADLMNEIYPQMCLNSLNIIKDFFIELTEDIEFQICLNDNLIKNNLKIYDMNKDFVENIFEQISIMSNMLQESYIQALYLEQFFEVIFRKTKFKNLMLDRFDQDNLLSSIPINKNFIILYLNFIHHSSKNVNPAIKDLRISKGFDCINEKIIREYQRECIINMNDKKQVVKLDKNNYIRFPEVYTKEVDFKRKNEFIKLNIKINQTQDFLSNPIPFSVFNEKIDIRKLKKYFEDDEETLEDFLYELKMEDDLQEIRTLITDFSDELKDKEQRWPILKNSEINKNNELNLEIININKEWSINNINLKNKNFFVTANSLNTDFFKQINKTNYFYNPILKYPSMIISHDMPNYVNKSLKLKMIDLNILKKLEDKKYKFENYKLENDIFIDKSDFEYKMDHFEKIKKLFDKTDDENIKYNENDIFSLEDNIINHIDYLIKNNDHKIIKDHDKHEKSKFNIEDNFKLFKELNIDIGVFKFIIINNLQKRDIFKHTISNAFRNVVTETLNINIIEDTRKLHNKSILNNIMYLRGTNSYSPLNKGSNLYKELECIFESDTDKLLNNVLYMTEDQKEMCLSTFENLLTQAEISLEEDDTKIHLLEWMIKLIQNLKIRKENDKNSMNTFNQISKVFKFLNNNIPKPKMIKRKRHIFANPEDKILQEFKEFMN